MPWRVGLAPPVGCDERVLALLSRRADADGWCRLSQGQIAALVDVSRRTVIRSLLRMEAAGMVTSWIQRRHDGGKAAKLYRPLTPCDIWAARAAKAAVAVVARAFRLSPAAIIVDTKGGIQLALARQIAAYLCAISIGDISATRTAIFFRRHRSTIDDAIRLTEERRDDAAFDERVSRMEMRLMRGRQKALVAHPLHKTQMAVVAQNAAVFR